MLSHTQWQVLGLQLLGLLMQLLPQGLVRLQLFLTHLKLQQWPLQPVIQLQGPPSLQLQGLPSQQLQGLPSQQPQGLPFQQLQGLPFQQLQA
ncbi:hypothetical protein HaLaN_21034 [Haematococcus lacustris]|uniref:Uncharacterized protein n=1 Tax=Haematococcus lacustris TaxID=44745 RepID=A0A699ZL83_HAELA|nr:hypothetical protein HaLaN_21034 [Haematococcus lacustris]